MAPSQRTRHDLAREGSQLARSGAHGRNPARVNSAGLKRIGERKGASVSVPGALRVSVGLICTLKLDHRQIRVCSYMQ